MTTNIPVDNNKHITDMTKIRSLLLFALVLLLLGGCKGNIPQGKQDYVGLWKNNQTSLLITADGGLNYERKGAVNTSFSGPIKDISTDKIKAGFLFINTELKIDQPPQQKDGMWTMVVNGATLYKADERGRMPQTTKVPDLGTIRKMVRADLERLDKGISSGDFHEYLDHAAMLFQSQFDNEKLKQNYKAFSERGLTLKRYLQGDLQLTAEPSISSDGVLVIEGRYPTTPEYLTVKASYVYSHPQWKTIGGNINLMSTEAQ
jgi:hypothetical protein